MWSFISRSTIQTVFIALHFWLWGYSYLCFYFDHTSVGLSLILTDSAIPLVIPTVICRVKFLDHFKILLLLLEFMTGGDQTRVSNLFNVGNTVHSMGRLNNENISICDLTWICPHPAVEFRNLLEFFINCGSDQRALSEFDFSRNFFAVFVVQRRICFPNRFKILCLLIFSVPFLFDNLVGWVQAGVTPCAASQVLLDGKSSEGAAFFPTHRNQPFVK